MASKPGILTDWPWKPLGNFKYLLLTPWVIHSTYKFIVSDYNPRYLPIFMIFPFLLSRALHSQIWISMSRHVNAKGAARILDRGIEFDQVDREECWGDQLMLFGLLLYVAGAVFPTSLLNVPLWRTDGFLIMTLTHVGPVEFLYYWVHRALHHHYLYSRYHSHHHSSIVTEPISALIHPFIEVVAYYIIFMIPAVAVMATGTVSMIPVVGYITLFDLLNNMGHCNFEFIPNWLFSCFPPLKFLMYTPSFHSLHHTQFRTNYCLFMPFYDYIYGTMDKSSEQLRRDSLERKEEHPDVVHLTHLTTPDSIYHLQVGVTPLASRPHQSRWILNWLMQPISTVWSMIVTWVYGRSFLVERHRLGKLKMQTWAIPKYSLQYDLQSQAKSISAMIEEAILDADEKGAKTITLGLLNQGEELNEYGEVYLKRNPKLRVKVVDGSSLAVAVILNSIPTHTSEVLLRGKLSKVAFATAFALSERGIQVVMLNGQEYQKLSKSLSSPLNTNQLVLSEDHLPMVWLVGDGLTDEEQLKAPKGTLFIPFSQFPPKKVRKDCLYHTTPAMTVPSSLENMHACENWLPRRVMGAWRVAGMIHALEEKQEHECGNSMSDIDQVWEASLHHGFQPLLVPFRALN